MTATENASMLARATAAAAADKKATDIVAIDVSEVLVLTDAFVLCSGSNPPQINAIVNEIEEKLHRLGARKARREGDRGGHWVLLDFGEIVVHVMRQEQRVEYALERLWKDCAHIPLPDSVPPAGSGGPA